MKRSKKGRLKHKLDKLIQKKYVPLNPKCFVCSQPTSEMHHFIQKSQSLALRFDPRNLVSLCKSCHYKIHRIGDSEIISKIIHKKGKAWEKYIYKKRRETFKDTLTNLNAIKDKLNKENK